MSGFPHGHGEDPRGPLDPPQPPDPPAAPPPPPQLSPDDQPQWAHSVPPPPPQFRQSAGGGRSLLRGLAIACLSCLAVFAGFFGTCFAVVGGTTAETIPVIAGSALAFIALAVALYFLIRPRN